MHDSMTIADVGSIVNVSGSRIATPFGPPRPGSTPTNTPSSSPTSISASVFHVSRTAKPCSSSVTASMASVRARLEAEQRLDRAFRHDDVERDLERHEHDQRKQHARQQRLPPRDSPDEPHEARNEQQARDVEAKYLDQR